MSRATDFKLITTRFVEWVESDPPVALYIATAHRNQARVEYEESKTTIWITILHTSFACRHRGLATLLLRFLASKGKNIVTGAYLEDGEEFLRHVMPRIEEEFGIRITE